MAAQGFHSERLLPEVATHALPVALKTTGDVRGSPLRTGCLIMTIKILSGFGCNGKELQKIYNLIIILKFNLLN